MEKSQQHTFIFLLFQSDGEKLMAVTDTHKTTNL